MIMTHNAPQHKEIFEVLDSLLSRESAFSLDKDFLKKGEITSKHREKLVEWLIEVADDANFSARTKNLAIGYVDTFLQRVVVPLNRLQLAGATALMVAVKMNESVTLTTDDIAQLAGGNYNAEQVADAELFLCRKLEFQLTPPSADEFAALILAFLDFGAKAKSMLRHAENFIELIRADYNTSTLLPSETAVTAVFCAVDRLLDWNLVCQVRRAIEGLNIANMVNDLPLCFLTSTRLPLWMPEGQFMSS
eukprot:TRINITY_DN1447_c0_g2_i1.p1 TRINITY_DN1447_c0_g2~~TRINITY_DN1447_c0_g2_i1.p1  ORF type:complete len:249 (-),score=48.29 TRINITY_DN1447_c0_g2_i1:400-1146(-)